MKTKILISASNGVVMKSLILILKKNFYIIGIDSKNNGDANKYCNEFYMSPSGGSKKFIPFLKKITKKVKFVFLFVDEEIQNVKNNEKLVESFKKKIVMSDPKTIDICLNKKKFNDFLKKKKINIPKNNFSKNMIAKPIYGRGSKDIFKIQNYSDYLFFKKKKNYILQEFIQGKEFTVDCLFNKNGKLLFCLARERIAHNGVSIIGKIIKDKAINNFILRISRLLNFYGPINVQLIKKGSKIYIIEINPRLSGSIEFSIKAGFNPFNYFLNKKFLTSNIKYGKIYKRYFQINEN